MINTIKAAGTAAEVCAKLEALRAMFPKGATLADVATVARFARITTIARQQAQEIDKRRGGAREDGKFF